MLTAYHFLFWSSISLTCWSVFGTCYNTFLNSCLEETVPLIQKECWGLHTVSWAFYPPLRSKPSLIEHWFPLPGPMPSEWCCLASKAWKLLTVVDFKNGKSCFLGNAWRDKGRRGSSKAWGLLGRKEQNASLLYS